jgi:hypothetical protein
LRREERRFSPAADTTAARRGYERWRSALSGLLKTDLQPIGDAE